MSFTPKLLKILVLENHLKEFLPIEEFLKEEHSGIELHRCRTIDQALQLLNTSFFDAVLLDLSLSKIEAKEKLVKKILKSSAKSAVIVLTNNSNKEFGIKMLSFGVSDYLFKNELNGSSLAKSIHYSLERKRIENQLIESQKNYKALFDYSPFPMFILEKETLDFLNVNEAAVKLYGYPKQEFLQKNVRELWAEGTNKKVEKTIKENISETFKVSISHRTKGGEVVYLDIQSNPVIFEGKNARISILNNITANVQAEMKLEHSEKRFKALVQEGSDLVMIIDANGNPDYVSPSSNTIVGIPFEELAGQNFFSRIHPNDVEKLKAGIFALEKNGRIQLPSYRYKNSKNNYIWLETIVTNLYDDLSINGIVLNSRDITEFITQEKKLINSLQRYDIVAKATSDTITDYDIDKDVMKYNEGIENMFGYSLSCIPSTGKWWNDHIHPGDRDRVKEKALEIYKNKGSHLQIEYRFQCADGSYKYILDRSYLVKDEKGNPVRMIGSMQDISELHSYIETIEKNNRRLKEIAWTQSHVVRAPLARIMGLIDLLENEDEIDLKDKDELLKHILKSAKELDAVIRKIADKTEQAKPKM